MEIRYGKRWKRADFRGWKYEKLVGLNQNRKVIDVYPHLKKYPELNPKLVKLPRLSFDKVLRYIMIFYSNNVLRYTIPEVIRRKREAAYIAGFNIGQNTGRFRPEVERMMLCENEDINKMIVRFLRRSENKKFLQLCVFEEARAKQMQKLIDGISEKEKELTKVVIENVKTLSDDIERLEQDLLNEDTSQNLIELIYDEVDYSNLGLSPEDIVEMESDGSTDKILKSPYVSRYDGSRQRTEKAQKQ